MSRRAIGNAALILAIVLAIVPLLMSDSLNEDHPIQSRVGRLIFALIHLPLFVAAYFLLRRDEGKRATSRVMRAIDLLVFATYAIFRVYLACRQFNMEFEAVAG